MAGNHMELLSQRSNERCSAVEAGLRELVDMEMSDHQTMPNSTELRYTIVCSMKGRRKRTVQSALLCSCACVRLASNVLGPLNDIFFAYMYEAH
jgi:hypothetical protein